MRELGLLLLLLVALASLPSLAQEEQYYPGTYFELKLNVFPEPTRDRIFIKLGNVSTAWPREIAFANLSSYVAFAKVKIANHRLFVYNSTGVYDFALPRWVLIDIEYLFQWQSQNNANWLAVKVEGWQGVQKVLVAKEKYKPGKHDQIRIISTHQVQLSPIGEWQLVHRDNSFRTIPPVERTSKGAVKLGKEVELENNACRAATRPPQLSLNFPLLAAEVLLWSGQVVLCTASLTGSFLQLVFMLISLVLILAQHLGHLLLFWALVFVYFMVTDPAKGLELVFRTIDLVRALVGLIVETILRVLHIIVDFLDAITPGT